MKKSVLLLLLLVTTIAAQAATDYNFYVGGVRVTSDNCSNITGSNITSGTAVFTSPAAPRCSPRATTR